jgi:hypothetical protein
VSYESQFANLFQNFQGVKAVAAHNVHDSSGKYQPGGTFGFAVDYLAAQFNNTGKDPTGLGCWCWMKLVGHNGHTTRIITAYQSCRSGSTHLRAAYNQQRQYFKERGKRQCAREIFRSHLLKAMHKWRENCVRLILLVDGNEDLTKHHLGTALRAELNMVDLVEEHTGVSRPATFCRGTENLMALLQQEISNLPVNDCCPSVADMETTAQSS